MASSVRILILLLAVVVPACHTLAQDSVKAKSKVRVHKFYAFWGWNRAWYTNSDIRFHGTNYDFTLAKVVAHDRQTELGLDPYLAIGSITIPQTNCRIGYYLNDHWSVSIGLDHMKYVMDQDQVVDIVGSIQNGQTPYDGTYNHTPIKLTEDFLTFEHTDGLNYINAELRRHDILVDFRKMKLPNITLNLIEGVGLGALLPKTNTALLGFNRYDEFHLAGFGLNGMVGLNFTFFDHFFIQSELKGGYINMPDIRTTEFTVDRARQHFMFGSVNFLVGANFSIRCGGK